MTIQQILLDLIDPNPYQTRLGENAEHVQALADDIRARGLLQIPIARPRPHAQGFYELAFGHSRLAACKLIADEAEKLARSYRYIEARARFADADTVIGLAFGRVQEIVQLDALSFGFEVYAQQVRRYLYLTAAPDDAKLRAHEVVLQVPEAAGFLGAARRKIGRREH